jgi:hypothetical protein
VLERGCQGRATLGLKIVVAEVAADCTHALVVVLDSVNRKGDLYIALAPEDVSIRLEVTSAQSRCQKTFPSPSTLFAARLGERMVVSECHEVARLRHPHPSTLSSTTSLNAPHSSCTVPSPSIHPLQTSKTSVWGVHLRQVYAFQYSLFRPIMYISVSLALLPSQRRCLNRKNCICALTQGREHSSQ